MKEKFKELRLSLDFTQEQFAHYLGTSKSTICNWESGRTEIPELTWEGIKAKTKPLFSAEAT
jgi:DNA-binding transcriptional regulator YiaG